MKKFFCVMSVICLTFALCGCGADKTSPESQRKSQIELVEEQLQGTWATTETEDGLSETYTFSDGTYVTEAYYKGEKLGDGNAGTYVIETDAIYTTNQKNQVKGSIPYEFNNGVLTLIPQNGTTMYKVD